MAEFRTDKEDPILPVRITHHSEQIWNGTDLEQSYNYLDYEFETERHLYHARAYLDEIRTVAIRGRAEKNSTSLALLEGVEIDQRILAYLRRRYRHIKKLSPTGYAPIE